MSTKKRQSYIQVPYERRKELIRLVYEEIYSIKQAARELGIPYHNAKAVHRIYEKEHRIGKKLTRFRLKHVDQGRRVIRHQLKIEVLNPYRLMPEKEKRYTCGTKRISINRT